MVCVGQSALTRCVLVPIATLLIPPAGMYSLRVAKLLPSSRGLQIAIELGIIYAALQAALPAALAVYPAVRSLQLANILYMAEISLSFVFFIPNRP